MPSIVATPAKFRLSASIESEKLTFGLDSMLNDTDRSEMDNSFSGSQLLPSDLTCSPDCYQSEVESGSFMMVG